MCHHLNALEMRAARLLALDAMEKKSQLVAGFFHDVALHSEVESISRYSVKSSQ